MTKLVQNDDGIRSCQSYCKESLLKAAIFPRIGDAYTGILPVGLGSKASRGTPKQALA